MLELPIGRLFDAYQRLASLNQFLLTLLPNAQIKPLLMTDSDYVELCGHADEFAELCSKTGLIVTHQAAQRVCRELHERPAKTSEGWSWNYSAASRCQNGLDQLIGCMRSETATKAAIILEGANMELFEPRSPLFGKDTSVKFPRISYEIDEAAKCLALGRSTACVFHLMRILEAGLNAMRACLSIPQPNNPNWGNILSPIETKVRALGKAHPENSYFEELHGRLDVIRRAWRNGTMHVEIVYT